MRALPLLLLLAGCATFTESPFDRPGTWQATGVNDANLRAMIAAPADLDRGRAAPSERGSAAVPAVTRLLEGRRPPLPNPRSTNPAPAIAVGVPGLGGGAGGGGAAAGGGG